MGLHRAGFEVEGCDINPMPRYPFKFTQGNAIEYDLGGVNFVWASPPCQIHTAHVQQFKRQHEHHDWIPETRAKLEAWAKETGGLWVIENVPRAPLRRDLVLTGDMFGLNTYRKRIFEANFLLFGTPHDKPFGPKTRAGSVTVAGHPGGRSTRDGWKNGSKADWEKAMGIDWMNADELAEAIPPAYAEYIGKQAMAIIMRQRQAA